MFLIFLYNIYDKKACLFNQLKALLYRNVLIKIYDISKTKLEILFPLLIVICTGMYIYIYKKKMYK